MTSMAGGGAISIEIVTSDEQVCSASIRSGRPAGLGKLFAGRLPAEAAILSRRLFTLCAHAQGAASELAVAAVRCEKLAERQLLDLTIAALAERVFETLRACILGWPWGRAAPTVLARASDSLRSAAAATRAISTGGEAVAEALVGLVEACGALGVPERPEDEPPEADTAFAILHRDCRGLRAFAASRPDALETDDDVAVAEAWARSPAEFALRPMLKGRAPEAGAYARLWAETPPDAQGLTARLAARLIDIRRSLQTLRLAVSNGIVDGQVGFASGCAADGVGYGAVETARGRLYHFIDLEQDARIRSYGIVAPTEWNFHPSGPFMACLLGARVGHGEAARRDVARVATLFDPCVAFDVTIREAVHA